MHIVSIMEEWARWAANRLSAGYPATTILGRLLQDMPSTKCTLCNGAGRLSGKQWHIDGFVECPQCLGKGKVNMEDGSPRINPAFIHSTDSSHRLPKIQFNFLAHKVDLVVRHGLTDKQRQVTAMEYQQPGSQFKKAKLLGISQQMFSRHLQVSHNKVRKTLTSRCEYL